MTVIDSPIKLKDKDFYVIWQMCVRVNYINDTTEKIVFHTFTLQQFNLLGFCSAYHKKAVLQNPKK